MRSIPSRGDGKEVNGYVDGEDMNDEWALKRCPNPSHWDRVVRAREEDASTSGETIKGEEERERSKEEEEWPWVSDGPPFLHPSWDIRSGRNWDRCRCCGGAACTVFIRSSAL